jgi:hypothetical protein
VVKVAVQAERSRGGRHLQMARKAGPKDNWWCGIGT